MIGVSDIKTYAATVPTFSCRQMLESFDGEGKSYSVNTVLSCMKRMVAQGVMEKVRRGEYRLAEGKNVFVPHQDEELKALSQILKPQFPLIRFCVWSSEDIKRFSHYVVNMNVIFVDVERDCEESVFGFLLNSNLGRRVYLQPTQEDYNRYIYGHPTIVIRTLISEAPLQKTADGTMRVTLEKILVDSVVDDDFYPFQEYESYRLFRSALDVCPINEKKLMRYASRRNHKAEIEEIMNIVKQNEIFD